jgi:hypothetical protein
VKRRGQRAGAAAWTARSRATRAPGTAGRQRQGFTGGCGPEWARDRPCPHSARARPRALVPRLDRQAPHTAPSGSRRGPHLDRGRPDPSGAPERSGVGARRRLRLRRVTSPQSCRYALHPAGTAESSAAPDNSRTPLDVPRHPMRPFALLDPELVRDRCARRFSRQDVAHQAGAGLFGGRRAMGPGGRDDRVQIRLSTCRPGGQRVEDRGQV